MLVVSERTRKIAPLKSRGDRRIATKITTATGILELWRDRGVAESDLSTEPDISHYLSLGTLPTMELN